MNDKDRIDFFAAEAMKALIMRYGAYCDDELAPGAFGSEDAMDVIMLAEYATSQAIAMVNALNGAEGSIHLLNLSRREEMMLESIGIEKIIQIENSSDSDLLRAPNLGPKSLGLIREAVLRYKNLQS